MCGSAGTGPPRSRGWQAPLEIPLPSPRSKIRIRDGRAKPIDLLAKYISAEDDDLAVEMHEPYTFLNGLTVSDMEDLVEDIQVPAPPRLRRGWPRGSSSGPASSPLSSAPLRVVRGRCPRSCLSPAAGLHGAGAREERGLLEGHDHHHGG